MPYYDAKPSSLCICLYNYYVACLLNCWLTLYRRSDSKISHGEINQDLFCNIACDNKMNYIQHCKAIF